MQGQFELSCICGRENSKDEAFSRLEQEIKKNVDTIAEPRRNGQRREEIESALMLLQSFYSGGLTYYPINGNLSLPEEVYERSDALVIQSYNRIHLPLLRDAILHRKHALCEKPLVPLLDPTGQPEDSSLHQLEALVQAAPSGIILMDSEHYSYKRASLLFYELLEDLLRGRKISRVEGCLKEIDNPSYSRTRDILSPANGTGLLLDTGIHLLSFITCLGGDINEASSEYAAYPGYFVDTYNTVRFRIRGGCFSDDARGKITVAKFIDRMRQPEHKEQKYLRFFLEDKSEIKVNFLQEEVVKRNPRGSGCDDKVISSFRYPISDNEYVNILSHFQESIRLQKTPRTSAEISIKTLRAISQIYTQQREEDKERYPAEKPTGKSQGGGV